MKKAICILLSLLFVLPGLIGLGISADAAFKVGDTFCYGSYPQTDVTASLGSQLDALGGAWTSYGYCMGSMKPSDLMRFKDVVYNGEKYRGVTFDNYRPVFTDYSSAHNVQQDNGYDKQTVYWFKYEPLRWRVLDPSAGLILCDAIIDSQPFNNYIALADGYHWGNSAKTYYACNYAESDIREWLNQDFYNTAFSAAEKAAIKTTALDNRSALSSDYDAPATSDKIFLLSMDEAANSACGFAGDADARDMRKLMEGTDYAKCQGLWVCRDYASVYSEFSCWWLRTPWSSAFAGAVEHDGHINTTVAVNHTNYGVCPALALRNLNAAGLLSIAVKTMPAKTVYSVGDDFSQSGLTLTASYYGGVQKTITSGFTCSGFSSATTGAKTVTVTYEGKTTTFTVTVNAVPVTLTGVTVRTMPDKFSYFVGESFVQSGLTLTATYSDGSTKTITSGFTCSGFSSAAPGISTITVNYEGKTTAFDVTINPAPISPTGVTVRTMPAKTVYEIGESFDQTGLTLTLTYSDGSTQTITEDFVCTGFSSATAGTKTITVTYKGFNTTFSVTVRSASAVLTGIAVKTMPKKTVYTYRNDKNLDLTGLEVEAKYSDGSTKPVDPSACTITGYSAKPRGDKTITVEYEGKTAQFKVTVKYAWWQWLILIFLLGFIWY